VGARKVVITDVNDDRLALARSMGLEHTLNPARESLRDRMAALGMTEGFDVGLEMSGAAAAFRQMIDAMNNGGKVAILGIAPAGFEIDWNKVIFKMLTLKGIYGREMYETWYKMIALVQSGLDVTPLITHRLPIERFDEGMADMRARPVGKGGARLETWCARVRTAKDRTAARPSLDRMPQSRQNGRGLRRRRVSGMVILLELAGAVALLLWATRMIQTGVQRAFGHVLKDTLRRAVGTAPGAALAGGGLAMALQSATAVAVIVSGFTGAGLVPVSRAITALLGADLGSALVALILQLDLSLLVPVLLLAGLVTFRNAATKMVQQVGRILLGVGLLLLSLRLIGMAAAPMRESALLPVVLGYLAEDWLTAFALAGLMALLFHSSIASILVVAALAQQGLVPVALILPVVLGINAGAAIIPVYLTRGMAHPARLVPLGNLILRGGGALLALAALFVFRPDPLALLPGAGTPAALAVGAHVAFNGLLLVLGLALTGPLARALGAALRPARVPLGEARRSALNESDLAMPSVAIANAARELMVICERVETMMGRVPALYRNRDKIEAAELQALDDEVDAIHTEIKLYLSRIPDDALDSHELDRVHEILAATIKLEQIADIITANLVTKAQKKAKRRVEFSPAGWEELLAIHAEVLANTRRAFSVVLSGAVDLARELARSKERLRALEQESETRHLERLRAGDPKSRETSTLHMDIVRDLKEINSLLVSLTYPVLDREGMLRPSRLV
jgi:phosphate:Na+ symporter